MGTLKPMLHQHLLLASLALGAGQLPIHPPSLPTLQLVNQELEQHQQPVAKPPQCCGTPVSPWLHLMYLLATASLVLLQAQHPWELELPLDQPQPHHSSLGLNMGQLQGQRHGHAVLHQAWARLCQAPQGYPEQPLPL